MKLEDHTVPPVVPGSIPPDAEAVAVLHIERPHSQAVCRRCGRILELALSIDELGVLSRLADRTPDGWRADGISFTVTGECRACQQRARE